MSISPRACMRHGIEIFNRPKWGNRLYRSNSIRFLCPQDFGSVLENVSENVKMYALDTPFEDLPILKPKGWALYTSYNSSIPQDMGRAFTAVKFLTVDQGSFCGRRGSGQLVLCVLSLVFVSLDGSQLSGKGHNGNSNDVPGTTYG